MSQVSHHQEAVLVAATIAANDEYEEREAYDEEKDELCVAMLEAKKAREMMMEQEKERLEEAELLAAADFVHDRIETFSRNMDVLTSFNDGDGDDDGNDQQQQQQQQPVSSESSVGFFQQARTSTFAKNMETLSTSTFAKNMETLSASTFAKNLETLSLIATGQCEAPWSKEDDKK